MDMGLNLATGEITQDPIEQPSGEAIQQTPTSVGEQTVPPTEADGKQIVEGEKPNAPGESHTAEFYKERRNTILALEQYFKDLEGGRIGEDDLKRVFNENPTLAEVAGQSKVLKDRYRRLVEGDGTKGAPTVKDEPEKTEEGPLSADLGSRQNTEADNGLSTAEERIVSAIYQKLRSEEMGRQAKQMAERLEQEKVSTASKYGLKDQEYKRFSDIVDSLSGVDGIATEDAVAHALSIIRPPKGSPVNLSGSMPSVSIPNPEEMETKGPVELVDLTKL